MVKETRIPDEQGKPEQVDICINTENDMKDSHLLFTTVPHIVLYTA